MTAPLRTVARLARWLGPWAGQTERPRRVRRRAVDVRARRRGERAFRAWVYEPEGRSPVGSLLIVPGLHYAGPSDRRLDRFAGILADAGIVVLVPFLPDFSELRVGAGLVEDTERALEALLALPGRPPGRPGVFSISFGSMPALRLASSQRWGDEVGGLIVFGGYADWNETIRFSLQGDGTRPHDPLNQPVVFMNLIEHLEDRPRDTTSVLDAWFEYVRETWGRPEMKEHARHAAVAERLASELDDESRELFLVGCGLEPGGFERCSRALERAGDAFAWLDPRPHLASVRCPVYLVHGRDDDVIPHAHAPLLARAMPAHADVEVHVTGMYDHTRRTGLGDLARMAPEAARELRSMMRILRAIAAVATDSAARARPEG